MTAPLRLGSLCSGYEGLGMAIAQVLDVDLAWVADPDPGATAILTHHHPDVPNLGNITAVDWVTVPPVDVLAGGYPCQPFSLAGHRKGTADDRHIWPYIADALRVLRPRLAIFENVANHLRLGFPDVLADLADLGFDAEWCLASASEVGAPHRRRRLFIVAWPANTHGPRLEGARLRRAAPERGRAAAHPDRAAVQHRPDRRPLAAAGTAAHSASDGRHEGRPEPARIVGRPDAALGRDAAADADGHSPGDHRELPAGRHPVQQRLRDDAPGRGEAAADADRGGQRPHQHDLRPGEPDVEWGAYGPAINRWARTLGRPAPAPTEPGRDGRPRLNPVFVEWLMGLPLGHVTAVPGLTRNQQLKALGNGVVPQQGAAALALLLARLDLEAAA